MLVKIHDIDKDEKIDRKDAYKAPNGFYYSSEDAYLAAKKIDEQRKRCIDYIYSVMEYESFMKLPSIFFKKLKDWTPYGYDVIYSAMMLADNSIRQAILTKEFVDEQGKISYISAIIQNKLNDAYKASKTAKPQKESEPESADLENIGRKSRTDKGVGGLLGADLWI